MMNSCLEKPCPWGFAFHHKYPIQLDYSGSFRYVLINMYIYMSGTCKIRLFIDYLALNFIKLSIEIELNIVVHMQGLMNVSSAIILHVVIFY